MVFFFLGGGGGGVFDREFAELFFHPVFSGSVLFSILHSSVLFKTLLFRAFC